MGPNELRAALRADSADCTVKRAASTLGLFFRAYVTAPSIEKDSPALTYGEKNSIPAKAAQQMKRQNMGVLLKGTLKKIKQKARRCHYLGMANFRCKRGQSILKTCRRDSKAGKAYFADNSQDTGALMDYNIISVFASASLVAQIIMIILIALSVLSWTVIFGKMISLSSAERKAKAGISLFSNAADLRQAVQTLGGDSSSPLYGVAQHGVREFNNGKEVGASEDVVVETVRRALNQGVSLEIDRLHKHLSILATAANTAPFIGLFGTVWGIMTSFHAIGQMKSASLATVAPGISEALIATAIGLAVAVPATIAYNMFLSKLESIETRLINFAGIFLNRVQREVSVRRSHNSDR